MKILFGLKCISDVENKKNLEENEYNFDEIEQVLENKKKNKNEKIKAWINNDNEEEEIMDFINYQIKEKKIKKFDFIDIDSEQYGDETNEINNKFEKLMLL